MKWRCCLFFLLLCSVARAETTIVNPSTFNDERIWRRAEEKLRTEPVEIVFADGTYYAKVALVLKGVGNDKNALTLRGQTHGKVVFQDDPEDRNPRNSLIDIRESHNIIVKDLAFTGPERMSSAMRIIDSQNITLEGCRFIDLLEAYYSALSITADKTDGVMINDCIFRRVGSDSTAHMIYTSYGPKNIRIVKSEFEDCAGDFLRFRDESDYGVVFDCTFKSTGRYREANPPMITVPLFNDDNPASQPAHPNYEYFGTHFLFANNTFEYVDRGEKQTRWAMMFFHSGYNPPGRQHLFSEEQGKTLTTAEPAARKKLLKELTGIDLNEVHVFGNKFRNVDKQLIYRSHPSFGAKSGGWQGVVDLSDLVDATPVVKTGEEAIKFFAPKSP